MHAYTNYTLYDKKKLFIYVQGLNSQYFDHYG